MLLLATSQGKSKTSGGIISDSLDENKIRDRELLISQQLSSHAQHFHDSSLVPRDFFTPFFQFRELLP